MQTHQSNKYKGKLYEKFLVVIPQKVIQTLGWKKGQNLQAEVRNDQLCISRQKPDPNHNSTNSHPSPQSTTAPSNPKYNELPTKKKNSG